MKKIYVLLLMFVIWLPVQAQVAVSIQILPPYPRKITDYASQPQLMVIAVTNTSTTQQRIQLRGAVTGDNGVELRVKDNYKSIEPIILEKGETRALNGNDLDRFFDYTKINYTGITQGEFINKNGLPEGSYRFCLRAYNYDTNQPISADEPVGCSNTFTISSLEPPTIIAPMNEAVVRSDAGQIIPFQWTTPPSTSPSLMSSVRYKIRMVEIFGNRNPNDALMTAPQPYFFEKEVVGNSYVYTPADPQLTPSRRYALMIEAFDPFNYTPFRNNGRSEVISFTYGAVATPFMSVLPNPPAPAGGAPLPVIGALPPVGANGVPDCGTCKVAAGTGTSNNQAVKVGSQITVGNFTMNVTAIDGSSNGLVNGRGTIGLPFIGSLPGARLRVSFTNLDVNQAMKMKSGVVEGILSGNAATLIPTADNPQMPNLQLGEQEAKNLQNFFSSNADHTLAEVKNSGNSAGFELPLGLSTGPVTIAIARIYFNAEQAWFEAAAAMDIPDGASVLALSGRNMCLNADNLCKTGQLFLSQDFPVAAIKMVLKKPGSNFATEPGTSITFDKDGFKSLSIDAEFTFPGSTITDVQTNEPVKARLKAQTTQGWADWVAEVQIPQFYVTGMQSIKFDLGPKKMFYDHSDFANPAGIPAQFTSPGESPINTSLPTWKGFYIPEIQVMLPEIIKNTDNNNGLTIMGSKLIIDANGFSGVIKNAGKVLEIGKGSMDGWYASIDNVSLEFFKSGFKQSSMVGKMVLPASTNHTSAENQLDYEAILTTPQNGNGVAYSFNLTTKTGIGFDALFMSVDLDDRSQIIVKGNSTDPLKADAKLYGFLSISNDPLSKIKVPGMGNLRLPHVEFNNLNFMSYYPYINKDAMVIKLASPQKSLAGFSFTANKPEVSLNTLSPSKVLVDLGISGSIRLAGDAIGCEANAAFVLSSGIEKVNGRVVWAGLSGRVTDISLAAGADLGALKLKGAIKYYNDVANADEGFVGALETNIAGFLTVNMRARFGKKADAQGEFNYFDFSALADFGQAGITFAPPVPLAIYGFGGGVYYNMNIKESSVPDAAAVPVKQKTGDTPTVPDKASGEKDPDPAAGAMDLLNFNPAGLELTPQRGAFGVQATILFGLTSRNTLDADATFSMGFYEGGGLQFVKINGNARLLTDVSKPLRERGDISTGKGTLEIMYDVPNKTFTASVETVLGVPNVGHSELLRATGGAEFYSGPKGWYLKVGQPEGIGRGPNEVTLLNFLKGTSYFEVGSIVDPMPQVPQIIRDLVGYGKNDQQNKLKKTPEAPRTYSPGNNNNSGLILGAATQIGDRNKEYQFLMFFGSFEARMGFDFSVTQGITCDNLPGAGGPGGWYAQGQAYLGAQAKLGISVDLFFIKGKFTIFEAGAAAEVRAGLPKPLWAEGALGGHFSVMDGAIGGDFNFRFSIGDDKCVNAKASAFAGLQLISQVSPMDGSTEKMPLSTMPGAIFNLKVGGQFAGSTTRNGYFEIDDYEQVSENGIPKKRYFLFDKSCITTTLNGTDVSNSLIRIDDSDYALGYLNTSYLVKNTQYTFKVTARMYEGYIGIMDAINAAATNKSAMPVFGGFIQDKGHDATQEMQTVFTTDDGFTMLPSSEYAMTAPLHSLKAVPVSEYGTSGNQMFIETKKVIVAEEFFKYPPGTTYKARIFRDGMKQGADIPVNMERLNTHLDDGTKLSYVQKGVTIPDADAHTRWSFTGPELQKNSDYTVLVIAKIPPTGGGGGNTGQVINKTTYDGGMVAGRLVSGVTINATMKTLSNRVNALSAGENIVGGFSFHTSKYATYQEKFNEQKITALQHMQKGSVMNASRGISTNHNIFMNWIPWKDGKYTISLGDFKVFNFPVTATLSGEMFSKADIYNTSSDEIFQPEYNDANGSGIRRNIVIPQRYKGGAKAELGTGYSKLKTFIADLTRIPLNQLAVTYMSSGQAYDHGFAYAQVIGGDDVSFTGNVSGIGSKVPADLPQVDNGQQTTSSNGMIMVLLPAFDKPVITNAFGATILSIGTRGQIAVTDPIQKAINKLTTWAVNPGDNMSVSNGMSNVAVWESVGAAASGFSGGGLNQTQMAGAIKGAVNKAGMR